MSVSAKSGTSRLDGIKRAAPARDPVVVLIASLPLAFAGLAAVAGPPERSTMVFVAVGSVAAILALGFRAYRRLGVSCDVGLLTFVAALIAWFFGPGLATSLSENGWRVAAARLMVTEEEALSAYAAVGLFALVTVITYQVRFRTSIVDLCRRKLEGPRTYNFRTWLFVLTAATVVALSFFVITAGGIGDAFNFALLSRTGLKPWSSDGNFGTRLSPFAAVASTLLVASASCGLLLAVFSRARPLYRAVAAAIATIAMAWLAFESGTRSLSIQMALPTALIAFRSERHRFGKIRLRWRLAGTATAVALLLLSSFQRQYRVGNEYDGMEWIKDDANFMLAMAQSIGVHEAIHQELTKDSVLVHIAVNPIPRVLWPQKPSLASMPIFSYYVWGIDITRYGGNALPSVVGQYYLSWGWAGILLIGLVFGLILRFGDQLLARTDSLPLIFFAVTVFAWLFISFRFLAAGTFGVVEVTFVALLARRMAWGGATPRGVNETLSAQVRLPR